MRAIIRKVTRIDPNKYRHIDSQDDRNMISKWQDERKEEAVSYVWHTSFNFPAD